MTQFAPGVPKTAIAPITVNPAGMSCEIELFLGPNDTTKAATSGRVPFVSTGSPMNVSLPIVMPANPGNYHGYIDVFAAGSRFLAYTLSEDVAIIDQLVLTGTNIGQVLWSGYIIDLANGLKQTWGIKNAEQQPVYLNPTNGTQILIGYNILTVGQVHVSEVGPFLVNLPSTSGVFVWNGGAKKFEGGNAGVDLSTSDNKQKLLCDVTYFDDYNSRVMLKIVGSTPCSGFVDVGQFFLGQDAILYGYRAPLNSHYQPALGTERLVIENAIFKKIGIPVPQGTLYLSGWTCTAIHRPRTLPDSAYVFSASVTYDQFFGGYMDNGLRAYTTTKIHINSLTGSIQPFKVVIAMTGPIVLETLSSIISIPVQELNGPISNYLYTIGNIPTGYFTGATVYSPPPWTIWANPDLNAVFIDNPEINNWIRVASVPSFSYAA